MTNPNNAIGTNAAYGGRTSVNAANDDLATYTSAGVLSGFALSPDTGMVLNLGGVSGTRDVAVAEDAGGNRTTINNISGSPISVTIPAAPASQSRIDAVVAYVANPPQGEATTVDNPAACGLIVVSGTASSSPSVPNDSAIRTAITADGAAGSTAYYAILGTVTVAAGTTNITSDMISAGVQATPALADGSVTSDKVDFTTLDFGNYSTTEKNTGFTWIDGKAIYKKTIVRDAGVVVGTPFTVSHGISNLSSVVKCETVATGGGEGVFPAPLNTSGGNYWSVWSVTTTEVKIYSSISYDKPLYITLYYTKTS